MTEQPVSDDPTACDALAVRAKGGDREAFAALVTGLHPQVVGFLAYHAPTSDLVDELTQATFVTAFERLGDYEPRGTFAGWLKGIARNLLRRELDQRARRGRRGIEALEALLAGSAMAGLEEEEAGPDPGLLARLRGCLERLPPRARLLAERRFAEDVPLNQLAQQFKQSRASVAKTIFTLRRQLRDCAGRGLPA